MQRMLFTEPAPKMVILLDYVATLVENGHERHKYAGRGQPYTQWIARERYRTWLVELLRESPATVLLVTARSERYRVPTEDRMREQLEGWMPAECFFNFTDSSPPVAKQIACETMIFPKYGKPDETHYLALESNGSTRAMYRRLGITATPVPYTAPVWTALPTA